MIRKAKRIMELAIEITHSTEADVIVTYFAHIDQLEVRIFEDGWKRREDPDSVMQINEGDSLDVADKIIAKLENLKDEA